jgi:toxin ParE1/3/4
MKYHLIIKSGAELDITDSVKWYDEKQQGLGLRFLNDLDQKLQKVQANPLHYQVRYKTIRMAFLDTFEDAIHYIVEENKVYVLAVLGTHDDPKKWIK